MKLSINHIASWRYTCQWKQEQIEKDVIRKNLTRTDYNYNIGDNVMVIKNQAYKYEKPFQGPYEFVQTWTNRNVTTKMGAVTARLNLRSIKSYDGIEIE